MARERGQRGSALHRTAPLAARSCRRAFAPRHGRLVVGGPRRVSREPEDGEPDRRACPRPGRRMRRPPRRPVRLRRERDPAPIVRWHGPRAIEAFLERLCGAAKAEDARGARHLRQLSLDRVPRAFVPRSRLLQRLPRVASDASRDYIARLHNVAGDRPLLLTRDRARQHPATASGPRRATSAAGTQPPSRPAAPARSSSPGPTTGIAAACRIEDWGFGLTDASAPAEAVARGAARRVRRGPAPDDARMAARCRWSSARHNGARNASTSASRESQSSTTRASRPSSWTTGRPTTPRAIAAEFDVQPRSETENQGLSARATPASTPPTARSSPSWTTIAFPTRTGCATSSVALVDGRARRRRRAEHPSERSRNSSREAIACGPGGPIHVLLSDTVAEHIPGCNMAFWKGAPREPSGGSIRSSASRATTWTSAGACSSAAGRSASAPARWCGTGAEARSGRI